MISDKTLELNNDMTVRAFVYRPNLSGKNFKNTKYYHFSINKKNLALSRFSSPSLSHVPLLFILNIDVIVLTFYLIVTDREMVIFEKTGDSLWRVAETDSFVIIQQTVLEFYSTNPGNVTCILYILILLYGLRNLWADTGCKSSNWPTISPRLLPGILIQ